LSIVFEAWKFLAGLALFLLGLRFLEQGLKNLAGRPFKKFLRRHTTSPLNGVIAGTGITIALQSSSIVSLMLIAFVGAGILTLHNAIGVIFGANLGSTATGWIVASLGFEVEIAQFALPFVAVGGLMFAFFERSEKAKELGRLLLGFGLLFVGLSFMKGSVEELSRSFDMQMLQGASWFWFFLVGTVMAAVVHSSSAVVVLALSALNAGIIPVESAALMTVGADLGTTSTAILGSLKGVPVQKQVAASHLLLNVFTVLVALTLMQPLLWFTVDIMGLTDPVFTLVGFHTAFNLLGVVILFPFIRPMARFLEKRFRAGTGLSEYISKVPSDVPDAATDALHKEILLLARKVLALNIEGLRIDPAPFPDVDRQRLLKKGSYVGHYEEVKQFHGEMVKYYLSILRSAPDRADSDRLNHYTHALKHLLKSAKSVKDVEHNIRDFEASSNDAEYALFQSLQAKAKEQYTRLGQVLQSTNGSPGVQSLAEAIRTNKTLYDEILKDAYTEVQHGRLSEVETATFLNANREIYSANKSFIEALADILLAPQEADEFDADQDQNRPS
jgi:phosphate:Na+ symporter